MNIRKEGGLYEPSKRRRNFGELEDLRPTLINQVIEVLLTSDVSDQQQDARFLPPVTNRRENATLRQEIED